MRSHILFWLRFFEGAGFSLVLTILLFSFSPSDMISVFQNTYFCCEFHVVSQVVSCITILKFYYSGSFQMESQDLSPFCSSQSILKIRINKREKAMDALQKKAMDNVSISVKNCILNCTVPALFLTFTCSWDLLIVMHWLLKLVCFAVKLKTVFVLLKEVLVSYSSILRYVVYITYF